MAYDESFRKQTSYLLLTCFFLHQKLWKKINHILQMKTQMMTQDIHVFFNTTVWGKISLIIASLSMDTRKSNIQWVEEIQKVFNHMKALWVSDCPTEYHYSNTFHNSINVSSQTGAYIIQDK